MPGWPELLLKRLKAPATARNVLALQLWAASEGMPAASHNPLATSMRAPDSSTHPPYTMPWYPLAAEGVEYTARTLEIGAYGYPAILAALRQDRGLGPIYSAVNASSWCKGCQNGHYPIRLHDHLGAFAPGVPSSPAVLRPQYVTPVPEKPWDYSGIVRSAAATVNKHATRIDASLRMLRSTLAKRLNL